MRHVVQFVKTLFVVSLFVVPLAVCGSNKTNANLGVTSGVADSHCVGVSPQEANICVCDEPPSGSYNPCTSVDTNNTGTDPNIVSVDPNEYGATMYGSEGDDDDCKYHVSWSMNSVADDQPVTFTVKATRLVEGTPLTGAAALADVFLNSEHHAPSTTPEQSVIEDPPGTYTIYPVVFDASGEWTARFHFYEDCDDTLPNAEHGHAAFYVTIP